MIELENALYNLLANDATLTAGLPGGIHWRNPPADASGRFLVYDRQTPVTYHYTKGQRSHISALYLVKIVERTEDDTDAQALMERADAILTDQPWFAGLMYCRRQSDVSFGETDSGVTYQHTGSVYEIEVRP